MVRCQIMKFMIIITSIRVKRQANSNIIYVKYYQAKLPIEMIINIAEASCDQFRLKCCGSSVIWLGHGQSSRTGHRLAVCQVTGRPRDNIDRRAAFTRKPTLCGTLCHRGQVRPTNSPDNYYCSTDHPHCTSTYSIHKCSDLQHHFCD
jgi:hypothetical protein